MLNMIRMELYRMFQSKSMYIVWAVMVFMVIITTVSIKVMESDATYQELYEAAEEVNTDNTPNIGMSVSVTSEPGETASVFDYIYGNIQGEFIALMVVIFTVIYSMADTSSGYIKNIAGQVEKRQNLVLAKAVAILTYVFMTMGVFVITQLLCNLAGYGNVEIGSVKQLVMYMGTQLLLHFSLAMVSMTIAILTKSTLVSMIVSVCVCMNLQVLLYNLIDKLVKKAGVDDFQTLNYTLTGKISMLPMDLSGTDVRNAAVVAVIFGVAAVLAGCIVFKKRDV